MSELNILEAQRQLASGEQTAVSLTQFYLDRIIQFDPALKSVLELNPDALALARVADTERKSGLVRGALHGIPVLIKDNISTADQMQTTAGSRALLGHIAVEDAEIVRRLREAGAIILGKTNMTEWANYMSTNMPSGYSSRGGQTVNPYDKNITPGGSSSGTGVAIAADFAVVGIGTETSGSILSPSNQNSLVGIKPTVGLISRRGIIPISSTQDTAGPMTRTVRDAAILLEVMSGRDSRDAITKTQLKNLRFPKLERLDLKGVRLGVPREVFWDYPSSAEKTVLEGSLEVLRQLGATVIDRSLPEVKAVSELKYVVLLHEFKRDLNKYLRDTPIKNLANLIRFNDSDPQNMLRYGQILLLAAQSSLGKKSLEYLQARAEDLRLAKAGLDIALETVDALLFPTYWGSAVGAKAGYPTIIVPAGYTENNLPVGLSFLGRGWSEPTLLEIAYAFEQATLARVPPVLS
jgi:amidase